MAAQELESAAIFGLLALFQAKTRGVSIPPWRAVAQRLLKPSLLSWLIARSLYDEYIDEPALGDLHSETAPATFQADPFFMRHSTTFVPPIYLDLAKKIGRNCRLEFLAQWGFEWTRLVEVTGSRLRRPYIDFWTREDDDHLQCLDLPLSEVYRSAYLRAIAWATEEGPLQRADAIWLCAHTCPVDLGLWEVLSGKQPDDWPKGGEARGSLDTIPGEIAGELAYMWQRHSERDWVLAEASGRVQETDQTAYDLQIIGVIQACTGPRVPEIDTVCAEDSGRTITDQSDDPLVFAGHYSQQRAEDWREDFGDWSIWRLATAVSPTAVPRWQWWRFRRRVWLPSPFLARKSFEFRCQPDALVVEEGGRDVARWSDWTHKLHEMIRANLPPSTGQILLIRRSLVEREAAKLGGALAWICKITSYHREYNYRAFTETHFVQDFGTTRIVHRA
jgi:hypothetical protein